MFSSTLMMLNLILLLTIIVRASASPAPAPEPQGVYAVLKPSTSMSASAGCVDTYDHNFSIQTIPIVSMGTPPFRPVTTQCDSLDHLSATLDKGILLDVQGRIGSIVANRQFQFDGPPAQAGAIYTGGFSICPGNYIALGGQHVFYTCPISASTQARPSC
jgi:hypothetical protein